LFFKWVIIAWLTFILYHSYYQRSKWKWRTVLGNNENQQAQIYLQNIIKQKQSLCVRCDFSTHAGIPILNNSRHLKYFTQNPFAATLDRVITKILFCFYFNVYGLIVYQNTLNAIIHINNLSSYLNTLQVFTEHGKCF